MGGMSSSASSATILDVARAAKVSAGTVSRVLNRNASVSLDHRQRVLKAIDGLNYVPRQRKASMADVNPLERKSVLLLMLGMDRSLASLPVVASALHGVEQAIRDANANLLIDDVPGLDDVPEVLRRNRVDAVILKGALQGDVMGHTHPDLLESLKALPSVWVLGRPAGFGGDAVRVNDVLVGQLAADHLIGRGHRRLAFINPKPSHTTMMCREASFTFYSQRAGATVTTYLGTNEEWHFPAISVDHVSLVQGLVDRLLEQRDRPTAIFAPSDSIGAMVARALAARGLQSGRDISLMSCNNERPLLIGVHPGLTTIDVHAEEIGRRSVDQLAWRITHPDRMSLDVGIEPTLVEGQSVLQI
jgi:DNA-binding LacI/PurR family transcriptional regulator